MNQTNRGDDTLTVWNARHSRHVPVFAPHPLAAMLIASCPPDGPILELACGTSGSALLLAAAGKQVTAVDISDVALAALAGEARARGLAARLDLIRCDLASYRPEPDRFAAVLCTLYWDAAVFAQAHRAVALGGLLAWEALRPVPGESGRWRLLPDEPAALLPAWFTVLLQTDLDGAHATRRLLAKNMRQISTKRRDTT